MRKGEVGPRGGFMSSGLSLPFVQHHVGQAIFAEAALTRCWCELPQEEARKEVMGHGGAGVGGGGWQELGCRSGEGATRLLTSVVGPLR